MAANTSHETAIFANGCFWGTEQIFRKYYGNHKGLIDAKVGYTGGSVDNPSYKQVCSGKTGHAEACKVIYDPSKVKYEELVETFYRTHDPTTADRQGADVGSQYRSAIFYNSPEQKAIAEKVTEAIKAKHPLVKQAGGKVATQIAPATQWYDAEDYHQMYLDNNPSGYHCSTHRPFW